MVCDPKSQWVELQVRKYGHNLQNNFLALLSQEKSWAPLTRTVQTEVGGLPVEDAAEQHPSSDG